MNQIEVKSFKSRYVSEEVLTIFIDNQSLDYIVSEVADFDYIGLISPFLDEVMISNERNLVIKRYLTRGGVLKLPILICPDDFDLSCTVIVVEVLFDFDYVTWSKMGVDRTISSELIAHIDSLGNEVEWFNGFSELKFQRIDCEREMDKYRYELNLLNSEDFEQH